jgi:2-polyprenyl-6-methoxyphenol hydroxylase-like FAD-dependent oxidoreductase
MTTKRKYPVNEDSPLNEYEKEGLSRILDEIEWREYQRVKHQTSGYVESKIVDYDEETVEVDVTVGIDGVWSDVNRFKINRLEILLSL